MAIPKRLIKNAVCVIWGQCFMNNGPIVIIWMRMETAPVTTSNMLWPWLIEMLDFGILAVVQDRIPTVKLKIPGKAFLKSELLLHSNYSF